MNPWETLGVSADVGVADLRRRYAALIKEFRPETHPLDFARIREAYEVVLPYARRREAAAEEEAEQAALSSDAAPDSAVAETPAPAQADATTPVDSLTVDADAPVIVAMASDEPRANDAEPDLATRFRRFHALAESVQGTRDEALLAQLRVLLLARTRASLDDSQALEFALTRWFVESESPPLTLLFETGRGFDWHHHESRLSQWLSPWALRRMETLLILSRDLVYARHFSANAWLRRLHAPGNETARLASRADAADALGWAERWRRLCEDAELPRLGAGLNTRTMDRLNGHAIFSTDLLFGFIAALLAPDLAKAVLFGVLGAAIPFALRLAWSVLRRIPRGPRLQSLIAAYRKEVVVVVGLIAGGSLLGVTILATPNLPPPVTALGVVFALPASITGIALLWRVLAFVETRIVNLLGWRSAVDRLEFDRFVRNRAPQQDAAPFGIRLRGTARLRAIPEALRFENREIAGNARPARPRPLEPLIRVQRKVGLPRILWFGAWIAFMILRVAHLVAGHA